MRVRARGLADALKTDQVKQKPISTDSLADVFGVSQSVIMLNMQRAQMNPEEIQYLADALKINKVSQYSH